MRIPVRPSLTLGLALAFLTGPAAAISATAFAGTALAATEIGANSCQGAGACDNAVGPIGDNSCNGGNACNGTGGPIGDNSCDGLTACLQAGGPIADGSCNGNSSCYISGAIGYYSCNNTAGCQNQTVGDCQANDVAPAACAAEQPDGLIRRPGLHWRGAGVLNSTGVGQTRRATMRPYLGASRMFSVAVRNSGDAAAAFRVTAAEELSTTAGPASASTNGFTVRYVLTYNHSDITASMEGTGYVTPVLDPGEGLIIRVRVTYAPNGISDNPFVRLVNVQALGDGSLTDTVRLIVQHT